MFFSILFFTQAATITADGHTVPGQPYPRDIWGKYLDPGTRSSCVFAFAECRIDPSAG